MRNILLVSLVLFGIGSMQGLAVQDLLNEEEQNQEDIDAADMLLGLNVPAQLNDMSNKSAAASKYARFMENKKNAWRAFLRDHNLQDDTQRNGVNREKFWIYISSLPDYTPDITQKMVDFAISEYFSKPRGEMPITMGRIRMLNDQHQKKLRQDAARRRAGSTKQLATEQVNVAMDAA